MYVCMYVCMYIHITKGTTRFQSGMHPPVASDWGWDMLPTSRQADVSSENCASLPAIIICWFTNPIDYRYDMIYDIRYMIYDKFCIYHHYMFILTWYDMISTISTMSPSIINQLRKRTGTAPAHESTMVFRWVVQKGWDLTASWPSHVEPGFFFSSLGLDDFPCLKSWFSMQQLDDFTIFVHAISNSLFPLFGKNPHSIIHHESKK